MNADFIDEAIQRHLDWISGFHAALAGRPGEHFDAARAKDDTACALGHWFATDIAKSALGEEYHSRAMALHAAFHEIAGEVVESLAANDPADVTSSLIAALEDLSKGLREFLLFAKRHLPAGGS